MPSYFYHLKFELYPTPLPVSGEGTNNGAINEGPLWIPEKHSSIFDELPSHPRNPLTFASDRPRRPRTGPCLDRTVASRSGTEKSLIDCGTRRPEKARDEWNIVILSEARQRERERERTVNVPSPRPGTGFDPKTAIKDWRFGPIHVESIDISLRENHSGNYVMQQLYTRTTAAEAVGPSMATAGKATKARYVPLTTTKNTDFGWGIVHLYREGSKTDQLRLPQEELEGESEEGLIDCTTVCIPAVPSYLSPSDFLGFIGDKWRDQISHYRMITTGRMNRYLVLMKFRDSKKAKLFGREFDGMVFNPIEPETCNIAFIKSITFETPTAPEAVFPHLNIDPFTPSTAPEYNSLKPFPPPTPDLIELPTCPVCLERMDDTTGLLTIHCQHVFHCSCLQKWKGSGCPVCRHTNTANNHVGASTPTVPYDPENPSSQPFGYNVSNLCTVCDCDEDLWICLICGNVGCGRYKGGHAKEHWKNTAHTFSLELSTQHVWDYAGDMWVHRLIRDKGDGKLVELPGHHESAAGNENEDVVPRAKLESIGMEYTHLLTSQLESQRLYFEEMLLKAVDKAAIASAAAEKAMAQANDAQKQLREVQAEQQKFRTETIPSLEKDLERERARATKSTELARNMSKSLQEEKQVSEGLMKRIEHINKEVDNLNKQLEAMKLENADLKDQNHDLTMFISGQEKLKELEAEGKVDEGEIQEGSVSIPEERRRRKGKGKAHG